MVARFERMYVCMYCQRFQQSMDQTGTMIANPDYGHLAEFEKLYFPCPRSHLRIWSRETGLVVPSCVSILLAQAEHSAYAGILPAFRDGLLWLESRYDSRKSNKKKWLDFVVEQSRYKYRTCCQI